jgi:polar amino acid transport system permease protein
MHWSRTSEYLPFLLDGAKMTVVITIISLAISTPLGLMWAFCSISRLTWLTTPVTAMVNAVRALPMLVLLFYIYFVFPDIGIKLTSLQACTIGLGFAYSTYISEIFRSGIESIDHGQFEAARSIGMGKIKTMSRVILPQAFRVALPPYSNTLLMLLKDSSIASTIAVTEVTRQGQLIAYSTFDNTTVYTMVAAFYLLMGMPLIKLTKVLEFRFGRHKRGSR